MLEHHYEYIAAVDLGSNSFHMIVVKVDETGTISVVDTIRETVRLGGGLDKDGNINKKTMDNALNCLKRFAQRIRKFPEGAVRVVGTNTLRKAKNSKEFRSKAQKILGNPIEIISGDEEARLIYLGVTHGRAAPDGKRLVVDIGGGSTEFIIGQGVLSKSRESLQLGCVSYTLKFFADGKITRERMEEALIEAKLVIYPIAAKFNNKNWQDATGCSGTIKAIRNIVHAQDWDQRGVSLDSLHLLKEHLIKAGHVDNLDLPQLVDDRKAILPAGLAVLLAVFESLEIDNMRVSEQSLREGVVYDIIGRIQHTDVRQSTIKSLANRWVEDKTQAQMVQHAAGLLFDFAASDWQLAETNKNMLLWAANLHEAGLGISHNNYHEHGAYILYNADMPGFSRQEQAMLAAMVATHRRKFKPKEFSGLPRSLRKTALRLSILLRMAVLLHRGRVQEKVECFRLKVSGKKLSMKFPQGWMDEHSLSYFDLQREKTFLKKAGFSLKVKIAEQ